MSWSVKIKVVTKDYGKFKVVYDEYVDIVKAVVQRNGGGIRKCEEVAEVPKEARELVETVHEPDSLHKEKWTEKWDFYEEREISRVYEAQMKARDDAVAKKNSIAAQMRTLEYMALASNKKENVMGELSNIEEEIEEIEQSILPMAFLCGLFSPYYEETYLAISVSF